MCVGLRIKHLRKEKGLSQEQLAQAEGVSNKSTICNYEIGKRQPDIAMLKKIAIFFNVTTDGLLGIGTLHEKDPFVEDYLQSDDEEKHVVKTVWSHLKRRKKGGEDDVALFP